MDIWELQDMMGGEVDPWDDPYYNYGDTSGSDNWLDDPFYNFGSTDYIPIDWGGWFDPGGPGYDPYGGYGGPDSSLGPITTNPNADQAILDIQNQQLQPTWQKILNTIGKTMGGNDGGWQNLAKTGGNLLSTLLNNRAINNASEAQLEAVKLALAEQKRQFDINQGNIAPWLGAGKMGLTALQRGLGLGEDTGTGPVGYGELMDKFTTEDFEADPGYQFRVEEGMKALDRTASARGSVLSGGAIKAAQRYNSGLASQEYGNAFNRFQIEQANRYNRLAGLSGTGQVAANQLSNLGQNYANNYGDLVTQGGNARASGYIQNSNNWQNFITGTTNSILDQYLLSKILGG